MLVVIVKDAEGVVWVAETGDEPRAYSDPKILLDDFVRCIAKTSAIARYSARVKY